MNPHRYNRVKLIFVMASVGSQSPGLIASEHIKLLKDHVSIHYIMTYIEKRFSKSKYF